MELDLLNRRASTSSGFVSMNNLDAQLCVVPDVSFNCSGQVTSLLLGATRKGTIGRTFYPEIQIIMEAEYIEFYKTGQTGDQAKSRRFQS